MPPLGPSAQKAHMSTQQPEALRLAEILELGSRQFNKEAAAELRRLHALNAELLEALQNIVKSLADHDDEGMIEHAEQMIAARAAIAKAEGREA